jgi:hypothetical protein
VQTIAVPGPEHGTPEPHVIVEVCVIDPESRTFEAAAGPLFFTEKVNLYFCATLAGFGLTTTAAARSAESAAVTVSLPVAELFVVTGSGTADVTEAVAERAPELRASVTVYFTDQEAPAASAGGLHENDEAGPEHEAVASVALAAAFEIDPVS